MRKKSHPLIWLSFLFLIIFSIQPFATQEETKEPFNPDKKYSVKQLQDDLVLLRSTLEEGHAGLYRYTSKEDMDSLFDRVYKNLNQPMTGPEFYRLLSEVIANINDGHTGMSYSPDYDEHLSNLPILIPFKLLFIQKKAYLFRNYSEDENFVPGGEVVTINDKPISEIIEKMLVLIPSDGRIQTSKYKRLESTYYFGRMYSLVFGKTTSFKIEFISPEDGSQKEINVNGLKSEELTRIFEQRYPDAAKNLPLIELEYRGNIAILTIRTFAGGAFNSTRISYPGFMKKTFRELSEKNIKHLIIDLRDNGGGDDLYGKILFAYLIDKPYMYYKYLEMNRDEYSFLIHTSTPNMGKNLKNRLRKNDRGTYDVLMHPNIGEQKPLKPTFMGKAYVLLNGRSFSGSGECTSLIHFHKKAVFIGEECGAGYYGNTSGRMPRLILPNTRLRVRIPMVRYTMAVSDYAYPDRGIIPDYPFSRTIEDYLNGKDTEMDFVLDLIKKQEQTELE